MHPTLLLHLAVLPDLSFQVWEDGILLASGRAWLEGEAEGDLLDGLHAAPAGAPEPFQSPLGAGQRWLFEAQNSALRVQLSVEEYPQWPEAAVLQWTFTNCGDTPLAVTRLAAPELTFDLGWADPLKGLWSFQGAAVEWGQNFAFRLPVGFARENDPTGHLQNGEGGGIPLLYFWNRQAGLALAHIETEQQNWHMPVRVGAQCVQAGLLNPRPCTLQPEQSVQSLRTLISTHQGDFFAPLDLYRQALAAQGLVAGQPGEEDYAPAWCSWGYEFNVRPAEITGVLPALQNLGIHWLTLDDRWFDRYGDWNPRPETFPGGAEEMKALVEQIHSAGGLVQIWWYPLCAEDGEGGWDDAPYGLAKVYQQHPDWLLLNADGSVARNNRGLAMLCPGLPAVREVTLATARRFIQDWGFDGHKLDNIYTVPACYHPAHQHADPQEACRSFAQVYRELFALTRALKPHSVTQICPCGTPPTFTLLPALSQAVTADPTSSAQVRQRIKFYKALLGPRAAVFADHVELTDGGIDFASQVGAGGVPATKFVWPEEPALRARLQEWWGLSLEKQALWKEWLERYAALPLAKGEYLNLYDLGFDAPEGHAIRLDGRLYYAFYTPRAGERYSGLVEFRGLGNGVYKLVDYVHQQELGQVQGPQAVVQVSFQGSLLVKAEEL